MMKIRVNNIVFVCFIKYIIINCELITDSNDVEIKKIDIIAEITLRNLKYNGWNNILFMERLPDLLYHRLKKLHFTFVVTDIDTYDVQIDDVVPYYSNVIVISCGDIEEFENAIKKIITLPYWHSLANIILYYHAPYSKETTAKIFFIYWYYRAVNVVIVQYDDNKEQMIISYFSPYMTKNYKLNNLFGCWTAKKIGMSVENFEKSFVCDKQCHNMTSYSRLRALHLGTCIGFDTEIVSLNNADRIKHYNVFEDKGKNLHGFIFYAYTVEFEPFFIIKDYENGTYTFHQRDGMIWNTMTKLLNFKLDITPAEKDLDKKFNLETQIRQLFSFCQRKADLILYPIYQEEIFIDVDYTFPYSDSGVCILSHRAGYETIVFDVNFVEKNILIIIEFLICLILIWFVFFIYNTKQIGKGSLDQAGKDLINTIKTLLSISLHNPPKRRSFRIFLTIIIWSFFVINFSIQATIISLFSVHKKDKEVNTFEDIINKGYEIEGITSQDIILPDTEETFRIISSRMKSITELFGCVKHLQNDSRRFCLMDCAIGRYLVRNMVNRKGEQYLHLASDARIHNYYINMVLHKNSPLTENFNKYIMIFFEAGLIKKWMEYKYLDFKKEDTVKALGMEDIGGIFECYGFLLGISCFVFIFEVLLGFIYWVKRKLRTKEIRMKEISLNVFTILD